MRPSRFLSDIPREYLTPLRGPLSLKQKKEVIDNPSTMLEFTVGAAVFHPHFGVGRVESIHPSSQGELIKVFFMKENMCKTLLKDVAPLRLVER